MSMCSKTKNKFIKRMQRHHHRMAPFIFSNPLVQSGCHLLLSRAPNQVGLGRLDSYRHSVHLFSLMSYQQADRTKHFGCAKANSSIATAAPGVPLPPSIPGWGHIQGKMNAHLDVCIHYVISTSLAPLAPSKSQSLQTANIRFLSMQSGIKN